MNPQNDDALETDLAVLTTNGHERPAEPQPPRVDRELLLQHLPACQPQEGSPPNTFTDSELAELQAALPGLGLLKPRPRNANSSGDENESDVTAPDDRKLNHHRANSSSNSYNDSNKLDITAPWPQEAPSVPAAAFATTSKTTTKASASSSTENPQLDWCGAPPAALPSQQSRAAAAANFRAQVRAGTWTSPTNGVCPGTLQCNLVVLPQGPAAFDFLLFCQRNPKACPLLEVCNVGSATPTMLAPSADLRTDIPKYAIYRHGKLERECHDVTDVWPENSVAFLIGCSFSYDGALLEAGIPLKSAAAKRNVPMYKTNLPCRPAGSLQGNLVVSMKPIPALQVSKHVEITSKYSHAHGGPVCVGCPTAIGIDDMGQPDWGDAIDVDAATEVPVFHACGVTPQAVLEQSRVEFAITHAAGHMFVTDLPADMGVV